MASGHVFAAEIKTLTFQDSLPVRNWKDLRDEGVILQKHSFTCAAAALATLLTHYYGLRVSEDDVVKLAHKDAWLSMEDLQNVAGHFGFKAVGLALGMEQLKKLKVPVIVYIDTPVGQHTAVLRGISDVRVWLADPSDGNQFLTLDDFSSKWHTRTEAGYEGKILLVLPNGGGNETINARYFSSPRPHYSRTLDLELDGIRHAAR